MNQQAELTSRQNEIAELFAWGASKKEVADRLFMSVRTVENHARTIYQKIGIQKVNELSAWWFCTHFNISFDLSPLKRKAVALMLLAVISATIVQGNRQDIVRLRTRTCRVNYRTSKQEV